MESDAIYNTEKLFGYNAATKYHIKNSPTFLLKSGLTRSTNFEINGHGASV